MTRVFITIVAPSVEMVSEQKRFYRRQLEDWLIAYGEGEIAAFDAMNEANHPILYAFALRPIIPELASDLL